MSVFDSAQTDELELMRQPHDYFGINLKVVWKTGTEDLPNLKSGLQKMIESIEELN